MVRYKTLVFIKIMFKERKLINTVGFRRRHYKTRNRIISFNLNYAGNYKTKVRMCVWLYNTSGVTNFLIRTFWACSEGEIFTKVLNNFEWYLHVRSIFGYKEIPYAIHLNVLWAGLRIRIRRFLGLLDPDLDPLVKSTALAIIKQKK